MVSMLCFEKAIFKIMYKNEKGEDEVRDVTGYLFDYGAYRFGAHKEYDIWKVTDLKSGCSLGLYSKTRKGIEDLLESENGMFAIECMEKLGATNHPRYKKNCEMISNAYNEI